MTGPPILVQIALTIGGLALVAVGGGNALIPALHDQAVNVQHWLDEPKFAELVALAQAAPGPNMLLIPLIGWKTAGIAGAAVALIAFLVPSTIAAVAGSRLIEQHARSAGVRAFRWALRPVAAGLMLSAAAVLLITAVQTWPRPAEHPAAGLTVLAVAIGGLAVRFKFNPLVWLALAAVAGALA